MTARILILLATLCAAACAPVANGEMERLYNRDNNDQLTQIQGRQDFRTFRQKTPSFLLF